MNQVNSRMKTGITYVTYCDNNYVNFKMKTGITCLYRRRIWEYIKLHLDHLPNDTQHDIMIQLFRSIAEPFLKDTQ